MAISEKSRWLGQKAHFPTLKGNIKAEVTIIGGGITGVTSAYLLAKQGKQVVLIEQDTISSGATGYTTAMLTQYIDTDLTDLVKIFGVHKAKAVIRSHRDAIDFIEKIVEAERISCDFLRVPLIVYANTKKQYASFPDEIHAAKKLGLKMNFNKKISLPFQQYGSLIIPDQAKFHPTRYVTHLAKSAKKHGARIFEKSRMTQITGRDPVTVTTKDGTVESDFVIVATHLPANSPKELFIKKGTYRTYMMDIEIKKGYIPEALYQDSNNPYHYFRIDKREKYDLMLIGGEDHRTDIPVDKKRHFAALKSYADRLLVNTNYKIVRHWDGPIIEPFDGIAYIGPLLSHKWQLHATGFSGNGITYGTISAILFQKYICGQNNPYLPIYDARRFPPISSIYYKGKDYLSILAGGALKNTFHKGFNLRKRLSD